MNGMVVNQDSTVVLNEVMECITGWLVRMTVSARRDGLVYGKSETWTVARFRIEWNPKGGDWRVCCEINTDKHRWFPVKKSNRRGFYTRILHR